MNYKKLVFVFCMMASLSCKRDQTNDLNFKPTVLSIYPNAVNNGDEVSVTFKGISADKRSTILSVKTEDFEAKANFIGYPNIVNFRVPNELFNINKIASPNLRINIEGYMSENGPPVISSFYPKLDRFSPEVLRPGEELNIYGYNFNADAAKNKVTVLMKTSNATQNAEIIYTDTELIKVKIPDLPSGDAYILLDVRTNDPNYPMVILSSEKLIRILKK